MRIKIINAEIKTNLSYDMIGYSNEYEEEIKTIVAQRPDINRHQLRRIDETVELHITYKLKGKVRTKAYRYYPGFTFDTASVPNFMKWLIDNDAINMLIPSLYHDGGYALNFDTRRFTDAMFRGLVRYYGERHNIRFYRFKSFVAWMGPASPVGKKIYNSIRPENHFNFGYCVEIDS